MTNKRSHLVRGWENEMENRNRIVLAMAIAIVAMRMGPVVPVRDGTPLAPQPFYSEQSPSQ